MKSRVFALVLIAFCCYSVSAQNNITKTAGVNYTSGVPTFNPSQKTGSEYAIDTTNGRFYQLHRTSPTSGYWLLLGQGIDTIGSHGAPTYAPTRNISWFAVNIGDSLYRYSGSGFLWNCLNCGGGGGGGTANNGVSDNEAGGIFRLGNRYMASPDAPFTMDRSLNVDGRVWFVGDLSDSTLLVVEGATDRVGIGLASPQRKLDVNGEVRVRDLTTDTPTKIVGADADGDFGEITVSTGLSLSGGLLTSSIVQGYWKIRDGGTLLTARESLQFNDGTTIAFTGSDDAVDAETDITAEVIDNCISNAKIRQGVARSVIGVTGNAAANVADIQGTADQVLRVSTAGTALAFGQVATGGITDLAVTTAKIADDAVTYAKIQNVVNDERLLGRVSGANGIVEELTQAQVQTFLGLTGTANRFALWTVDNTLSSDAAFTFDAANDRATFTGTVAGLGANAAFLNLNSGAIAGATTFLRCSGNINGNMIAEVANSNNSNAANHTLLTLSSGGALSGDAVVQFTVAGAMTHAIGIDNTDDRLKMTPNAATPGANANMGICVRDNAGLGNTGINIDFPVFPLTVKGRARLEEFIGEGNIYVAGNLNFGNGAGTGPTLTTIVGTNNMVMVRFTTGTAPTANGDIFTITYPLSFPNKTGVTFSAGCDGASAAAGNNAATDISKFKVSQSITNNFIFKANGTLAASSEYAFTFQINGY